MPEPVREARKCVLHVEDDYGTALLVELAFAEADPSILCYRVDSVEKALALLSRYGTSEGGPEPCLILLDLNLPPKSGFEVLAAVRSSKSLDHIPVVVFTASAALSDRTRSLAMGARAYIRKPYRFEDYVSALRDVIGMIPDQHA